GPTRVQRALAGRADVAVHGGLRAERVTDGGELPQADVVGAEREAVRAGGRDARLALRADRAGELRLVVVGEAGGQGRRGEEVDLVGTSEVRRVAAEDLDRIGEAPFGTEVGSGDLGEEGRLARGQRAEARQRNRARGAAVVVERVVR